MAAATISVSVERERPTLDHGEGRSLLFMLSVTAPAKAPAPPPAAGSPSSQRSAASSGPPTAGPLQSDLQPPPPLPGQSPASTTSPSPRGADLYHLEACGSRWRVRCPTARRSLWSVAAQRVSLRVEAIGGAKVERMQTLLDQVELAPCSAYEVNVGDLYAGETRHVLALIALPALAAPVPSHEVVRFSLSYVDALRIETDSVELTASVARPAAPAGRHAGGMPTLPAERPPALLERERRRVVVADALQRAAVVANAGNPEAACVLLEEVEASLLHGGAPTADEMVETVGAALRSLASVLQRSHRGVWRRAGGGAAGGGTDGGVGVGVGGVKLGIPFMRDQTSSSGGGGLADSRGGSLSASSMDEPVAARLGASGAFLPMGQQQQQQQQQYVEDHTTNNSSSITTTTTCQRQARGRQPRRRRRAYYLKPRTFSVSLPPASVVGGTGRGALPGAQRDAPPISGGRGAHA